MLIKRKIECQRHMVVVANRQISNLFLVPFCFSFYNFQSNTYHLIKLITWEQHKQLYLYKCKLKKSGRPDKNSTQHPYGAKSNIIKTQLSIRLVYAKFSLLIKMSPNILQCVCYHQVTQQRKKQSLELVKPNILQSTTFTHKNGVVQDQDFNKRISKAFYQQNKGSKLFVKQRKKL